MGHKGAFQVEVPPDPSRTFAVPPAWIIVSPLCPTRACLRPFLCTCHFSLLESSFFVLTYPCPAHALELSPNRTLFGKASQIIPLIQKGLGSVSHGALDPNPSHWALSSVCTLLLSHLKKHSTSCCPHTSANLHTRPRTQQVPDKQTKMCEP